MLFLSVLEQLWISAPMGTTAAAAAAADHLLRQYPHR